MTEKEWEKFFDLLHKIVNDLGGSFQEKTKLVKEQVEINGAEMDLDEFCSWFE